jgi:threonine/homoserine/homoserine lactone efflux protein
MIENFWLFALSAFLLNITPGNDMLYIIARSSSQGTKAGIISSFGIMAGGMVHTTAAVIGLSAIIAESALAFTIIKFIGAAYLIYLGIKAMITKNNIVNQKVEKKKISNKRLFLQGALTNILNPKVALFFLAFLPQFINVHTGNIALSILLLGIWFNIGGTIVNILVALLFGKIGKLLSSSPGFIYWLGKFTGIILLGLGIKVAVATKK